jgi:diguanylate cyclase (GGDEF)-like protein/PAS domain S-box-containing protein
VLRRLIATSNDAFITADVDGRIREWNQQAEAIFGWTRDEILGQRLVDTVIPPTYRQQHTHGWARYLISGQGTVLGQRLELEGRRRDGTEFPVELTIWALGAGTDITFNALLHDVTERRRVEEQLWELALVDDLTGLHNRRAFLLLADQAAKESLRANRPVIAVFVDVDHLKAINDAFGHTAGDQALRLVADALRASCRSSDIVARLSGDEFAILLAEATELDGIERRIRRHVTAAAATVDHPLSVSVGIAISPAGADCDLTELLARADSAMYADKAARRPSTP